ncbi:MAG: enoyl-CoA hydratase [Thermodesulfobacteriota bacterium]|nr:enoyl-CoA hydratase [Thermodesulfobacteriota bacterium]
MNYQDIQFKVEEGIGFITLNRPEKRNALSMNLMLEMINLLKSIKNNSEVKVVIIRGEGPVFSSGHDLSEMLEGDVVSYRFIFDTCTQMMQAIRDLPQPVIAQVQGMATAAGCQLVATCDLAVAEESARFATPGVRIGLFCHTPQVPLSRAVGRKRAMEMLLTGRPVTAEEAERYGLINKVVPANRLAEETLSLAKHIAQASPLTLALGKKSFYSQIEAEEARAYDYAQEIMSLNAMTEDAREGISAFLQKRTPQWKGK